MTAALFRTAFCRQRGLGLLPFGLVHRGINDEQVSPSCTSAPSS
ncbi:MAG: hypothetical protein ACLSHC_05070 [Bilophila wadsworthia]